MEKQIRVQEMELLWTTSNSPYKTDIKQPDESEKVSNQLGKMLLLLKKPQLECTGVCHYTYRYMLNILIYMNQDSFDVMLKF